MTKTREALVGLVIVAAVGLTVLGTLWLQGVAVGVEQRDMEAVFHEVGQIKIGNAVKLRGVQVGRVREIAVEPDGQMVRLTMRVEEAIRLPEDPVVVLSPETMFGDWQAEIHSRTRFPHASYPDPPDRDVLPGYALPDISQLTATADRISESIAVLTERVGIAFSDETAQNIASLIDNVEDVTTRLSQLVEQQATSFADVTADIRETSRGISATADEATRTIQRLDGILARSEVDSTLEDLAVIAANVRVLSSEFHGTNEEVREMAQRLDSTFVRAEQILGRVERGEGSLGRMLHDPTMAAEMEETMQELQLLLMDIRENPRRYLRLSIF